MHVQTKHFSYEHQMLDFARRLRERHYMEVPMGENTQRLAPPGPPRSNPSLTAAIALGDADRLTPSDATLSVPHLKEPSHDHCHHQRWR
jgi:hypothetical protein